MLPILHLNGYKIARIVGLAILHLNGYKIASPTILARMPEEQLVSLLRGYGWNRTW